MERKFSSLLILFLFTSCNGAALAEPAAFAKDQDEILYSGGCDGKNVAQVQIVDDGPAEHYQRTAPPSTHYELPIGRSDSHSSIPEGGIPLGNGFDQTLEKNSSKTRWIRKQRSSGYQPGSYAPGGYSPGRSYVGDFDKTLWPRKRPR